MGIRLAKRSKRNVVKGLFNGVLVKLAALAVAVGCVVIIVTTNRDCSSKQEELDNIQTKIDSIEAENSGLQRVLDSKDMSAYMEKVAVEEYGYAYSDERRFYDTSRD